MGGSGLIAVLIGLAIGFVDISLSLAFLMSFILYFVRSDQNLLIESKVAKCNNRLKVLKENDAYEGDIRDVEMELEDANIEYGYMSRIIKGHADRCKFIIVIIFVSVIILYLFCWKSVEVATERWKQERQQIMEDMGVSDSYDLNSIRTQLPEDLVGY